MWLGRRTLTWWGDFWRSKPIWHSISRKKLGGGGWRWDQLGESWWSSEGWWWWGGGGAHQMSTWENYRQRKSQKNKKQKWKQDAERLAVRKRAPSSGLEAANWRETADHPKTAPTQWKSTQWRKKRECKTGEETKKPAVPEILNIKVFPTDFTPELHFMCEGLAESAESDVFLFVHHRKSAAHKNGFISVGWARMAH